MDLTNLLKKYKKDEQNLKWSGTFEEYLKIVKQNPSVSKTAHQRVYNMIMEHGVSISEDGTKTYKFFEKELFGLDKTIEKLVEEYFRPAALGLDVKKRMLLMMGPVSGGKSTISTLIKRGLEHYSRTDNGALYAIKGCPMQSEPLLLIPNELRPEFEKELGVKIVGQLNPQTRLLIEEEYQGDFLKVPVERIILSEQRRVGIGTFSPSDPKSQDIADLIGDIDFAAISTYGSESDPRAYRFDGELNISNRGVVEFQEVLKCDEKFLWHLLSLTQEGNFKAGRFALIDADELILAHTNETEYVNFSSNDKNEALRSRMLVINVPYTLRASDEEKVYQKSLISNGFDTSLFAPLALRSLAEFVVMTRLEKNDTLSAYDKMKLYDGQDTVKHKVTELEKFKHEREGMFGIDLRFVINRLSYLAANSETTIDTVDLLTEIKNGFAEHPSIKKDKVAVYESYIETIINEYVKTIRKDVEELLFKTEDAKTLFSNYLTHIKLYCSKEECNEKLMRSIEEVLGISENAKSAFRNEIFLQYSIFKEKGKEFKYDTHDRLKEAVHRRVLTNIKEVIEVSDERLHELAAIYAKEKNIDEKSAFKLVKQATESIVKTA